MILIGVATYSFDFVPFNFMGRVPVSALHRLDFRLEPTRPMTHILTLKKRTERNYHHPTIVGH